MTDKRLAQLDLYRQWLYERPLRDVPDELSAAWLEVHEQLSLGAVEDTLDWWRAYVCAPEAP